MDDIFGIQMTSIMITLLVVFGLCLAVGAYILIRNRVIFRMGVRNIPRRPAQTVLIVIGLMLSTLIIASALTTGDTMSHSFRSEVYNHLGQVDQTIVVAGEEAADPFTAEPGEVSDSGITLPTKLLRDLRTAVADVDAIGGVMGVVSESVPAVVPESERAEPVTWLTGLEPDAVHAFGGMLDLDGNVIDLAALADGEAILSEKLAGDLNLEPGGLFVVFVGNQPHEMTVHAIAPDSVLTGVQASGMPGGFAVPLTFAQNLVGYTDELTSIVVTNRGDEISGADRTDEAISALTAALAGTEYEPNPVKQDMLAEADLFGETFMSMFVILGMFSVAAGVLLIFLIFVLLAAERKPEMGMARAVGMKRRQLAQMYLAEGLTYDLAAAAVGAALGVGVAWAMAGVIARLLGEFIVIEPAWSWQSLVVAYTLGVTVTFITIVISSWRVSKLNIVSAIRDIPDEAPERETRKVLIFGAVGLAIGSLMMGGGAAGGSQALYSLGISLIPLCLAAILRRFGAPPRPLYTVAAGLVLAYWVLPWEWVLYVEPVGLEGDMEMLFISGIMMIAAATVLIVWNATLLTNLVSLLGQSFSRWLPAVKTAVAYPLANKLRTGMTISLFSLIIFSIVTIATVDTNFDQIFAGEGATGGWDIQAVQVPLNPIEDFEASLDQHGIDASQVDATGRLSTTGFGQSRIRMAETPDWRTYTILGADENFMGTGQMPLQTRAEGFASDDEVWQAVRDNPEYALVDGFAVEMMGFQPPGMGDFKLDGVHQMDNTMEPTSIEIAGPDGTVRQLTVIGVIDQSVIVINGVLMSEQAFDQIYPSVTSYSYFLRTAEGVDNTALADEIGTALVTFGVQADSLRDFIDEQMAISRGFLYLLEGFMGLGLIVGIAALGVVAFRSVVERRQQIGMLRAIGYSRAMIAASVMIESAMITVLGVVSGTALALWLGYQLMTFEDFIDVGTVGFIIPWGVVLLFAGIALAASLLMAYIPARQAARLPIAEALRYE
jgi:putative ABC transport system permease protein